MTTMEERVQRTQVLIAEEPVDPADGTDSVAWLRRLCSTAVRVLPAWGSGVSIVSEHGVYGVAAASDLRSRELEALQVTFGEGPCVDAFSGRHPVLESDLDTTMGRWPAYGPEARDLGVRAVFAFPLQVGAARLGVLDIYREEPGPLSSEALSQALTFAEIAVRTLLDGQEQAPAGQVAADLQIALEYRTELYQAQGMVMVDLKVPLAEAMIRLRAFAYSSGRPLGEVAREIVSGRLRLEADR